jgi:hypothetical protein
MRTALAALSGVLVLCGTAAAQPPPGAIGPQAWMEARAATGGGAVVLHTAWAGIEAGGRRSGTVSIERRGADLTTHVGGAVQVHRGTAPITALAVREQFAAVLLAERGAQPRVRVALVELGASRNGSPAAPRVRRTVTAPRKSAGRFAPSSALIAPDPTGFTVIWQEQLLTDPNADVRTYLGRLAPDGRWTVAPHVVAVPWALAGVAWNGHGWHLALYFGGGWGGAGSREQTRLCLVTLNEAGTPEQHPWWISPAGEVDEAQVVQLPDGIAVIWRGGADGTALRSHLSQAVGSWGQEPGTPPTDHGIVPVGTAFASVVDRGQLRIVQVR